jgi:putative transposase
MLCSTMKAEDVTTTLNLALKASELDQAKVIQKPRLLSDNVLRAEGDRIGGQSFSVREHALAA